MPLSPPTASTAMSSAVKSARSSISRSPSPTTASWLVASSSPAGPSRPLNNPSIEAPSEPKTKRPVEDGSPKPVKKAKLELKGDGTLSFGPAKPKQAESKPAKLPSPSSSTAPRSLGELPAETQALLRLEMDTMGADWLEVLQGEFTKKYFLDLKRFLQAEMASKKVFPPAHDIYSWSRLCPLKDVRVVIIGQDPYHNDGQAHGLAFSVKKPMRPPPSLKNIYKQMHADVPAFKIPTHGDLTEWAKHGVLLLNTSLTVRAHEAGSHSKRGWETFTTAVIRAVVDRLAPTTDGEAGANGVCFMAWGAHAAKMLTGVDEKKHLILRSAHPSPLSAHRGFLGNEHFKKSNEWLVERYGDKGGIDWASLGA